MQNNKSQDKEGAFFVLVINILVGVIREDSTFLLNTRTA